MPEEGRVRTETSHLSVRGVAAVLVGIAVVVGLLAAAMKLYIDLLGGPAATAASRLPDQAPGFGGPRLAIDPHAEPSDYAREVRPRLEDWGWTDRTHRTARIPVEEAARLLARHGWPDGSRPAGGGR